MSRRKKKNRKVVKGGFIVPRSFTSVVVFFAATALLYLWLSSRCETLGVEIKKLESERVKLNKNLLNEEYKWSHLKSPKNIEKTLSKYGITMGWPSRNQVVWLPERTDLMASVEVNKSSVSTHRYASITRPRRNE